MRVKKVRIIAGVLILLHWLFELPEWMNNHYDKTANKYIWPFIKPGYKFYNPKGIKIKHWIHECAVDTLFITLTIMLLFMALKIDRKLATIFALFLMYHCFDYFMLWWDYKDSYDLYFNMNITDLLVIVVVLWQGDPKMRVVPSRKPRREVRG